MKKKINTKPKKKTSKLKKLSIRDLKAIQAGLPPVKSKPAESEGCKVSTEVTGG